MNDLDEISFWNDILSIPIISKDKADELERLVQRRNDWFRNDASSTP